jgi:hypothetical protein
LFNKEGNKCTIVIGSAMSLEAILYSLLLYELHCKIAYLPTICSNGISNLFVLYVLSTNTTSWLTSASCIDCGYAIKS